MHPTKHIIDPDRWLRLKLITAFGGDVVKADVALKFVNGNTEASEEYRRFKEWETAKYRRYCQEKRIILGKTTSSEGQ